MEDTTTAPPAAGTSATTTSEKDDTKEQEKPKTKKRQGVVLAAEKKVTSKLLDKTGNGPDEKIFVINEYVMMPLRMPNAQLKQVHSYAAISCRPSQATQPMPLR